MQGGLLLALSAHSLLFKIPAHPTTCLLSELLTAAPALRDYRKQEWIDKIMACAGCVCVSQLHVLSELCEAAFGFFSLLSRA